MPVRELDRVPPSGSTSPGPPDVSLPPVMIPSTSAPDLGSASVFKLIHTKTQLLCFVGAIGLYAILTIGLALTSQPHPDEGFFANPAFNLVTKGTMGTSVLDPAGHYMTGSKPGVVLSGIKERTYWIMPLHILAQAAWYKMFGFSTLTLRTLSILWSLLALLSWFFIVTSLLRDRQVAVLACVFLAFDYSFMITASSGRMDMMCAALGFAAMALYLYLRERNLTLAVLASQALVVVSGLTHPNGVMAFAGVQFLALYLDRGLLNWRHLLIGVIPYLVGAASWGIYILQSPADFLAQFGANAGLSRLQSFTSPWEAIKGEVTERYLAVYGLAPDSIGLGRLKILVLIAYCGSLLSTLFLPGLLLNKGYRMFLGLTAIYFVLQFLFSLKLFFYLVHTAPFLVTSLAICLYWSRLRLRAPVWLVTTVGFSLLIFQVCWAAHGIVQNHYQNWYTPSVDYLKRRPGKINLIVGSAEIGLDLKFPDNFIHDVQLGYRNGRMPDIIVVSVDYESTFKLFQTKQPELYQYITRLLTQEYAQVYSNAFYRIYARPSRPESAVTAIQ